MGATDSRRVGLARTSRQCLLRNRDLRSVLQLFKAAVGHNFAFVHALDRGFPGLGNAGLYISYLSLGILYHVNERGRPVMLNRGTWQQDLVVEDLHSQPRIHKLVRIKLAMLVLE